MNRSIRLFYLLLCLVISVSLGSLTINAQGPDIQEIGLPVEPEDIYYDVHSPSVWLRAYNQYYRYDGKNIEQKKAIKKISEYSIKDKTFLATQDKNELISHGLVFSNDSLPFDTYIKSFAMNDHVYVVCSQAIWKYSNKWESIPLPADYENGTIIDAEVLDNKLYYGIGNALISDNKIVVLPSKVNKLYTAQISDDLPKLIALTNDNNLYVVDSGQAKKLLLPDVGVLSNILDIYIDDYKAYFLSDEEIYLFNAKSYTTASISISNYIKDPRYICVDRWSNMWIASPYKLLRYNENRFLQEPVIRLDSLKSSTSAISNGGTLYVSEDQELLSLAFDNYSLTGPLNKLYFKWNDQKWQASDGIEKVHIYPIPNEPSTLKIGHSFDGNEVRELAHYSVRKHSKSKNTWLWYVLAGAGGLILLLLRSFFKLKTSIKENQLLSRQNTLKKESQELQHEVLKLQMNPHFLYNSLNSISGLIAIGDNAKARKSISSFSKLMRQILDQSRDQRISIDEEIKFLESYISLEKLNTSDVFSYSIKLDAQLDLEESIPTMIIQPFVENAILHGLSTKDDGLIKIELKDHEDYIIAIIEDNGIGRVASAMPNRKHKSAAMSIVEERLSMNAFRKGHYEIIDKKIEGIASGTLVTIYIPKQ